MSKNAAESQWVERERIHAERRRKPFFPLLLSGDGWFSLGNIQFVDVRGGKLPPRDYYEDIAKFVPRKANPASIGAGVKESASPKKNLSLWIGGVALLGLLVMSGFALRNIFRDPEPPVQVDVDPTDVTAFPVTMPVEPVDIQLTPPADAKLGDTWTRPTDGMVMSYIPAGEFLMGSEPGVGLVECQKHRDECQNDWFVDEELIHVVSVNGFWIDQTEVTNAMYASCVETGRCDAPFDRVFLDDSDYADHPVVYVTWDNALNYCERVGGYLPSEAEWEKAARNSSSEIYPWGNQLDCNKANYSGCIGDTTSVGNHSEAKNVYGLYDMAGNVWEWVSSRHLPYPYSLDSGREDTSILGDRVIRGGSWYSFGDELRVSYRYQYNPLSMRDNIGFRCARSASE